MIVVISSAGKGKRAVLNLEIFKSNVICFVVLYVTQQVE